jgi:hypothetical protein
LPKHLTFALLFEKALAVFGLADVLYLKNLELQKICQLFGNIDLTSLRACPKNLLSTYKAAVRRQESVIFRIGSKV